jgi:hypothetical protein
MFRQDMAECCNNEKIKLDLFYSSLEPVRSDRFGLKDFISEGNRGALNRRGYDFPPPAFGSIRLSHHRLHGVPVLVKGF